MPPVHSTVIMAICEDSGLVRAIYESVEWDVGGCHRSPDRRIAASGEIVLTEGVALEPRDGFFKQSDTAHHRSGVRFDTEVARDDITDHNRRAVIDKVVDAGPRSVLRHYMANWQKFPHAVHRNVPRMEGKMALCRLKRFFLP